MKKKIIPILLALMVFMIPFGSVFAADTNLILNKLTDEGDGIQLTDSNTSTYFTISGGSTRTYTFSSPVTINKLNSNYTTNQVAVFIYNSSNVNTGVLVLDNNVDKIQTYSDVKKVTIMPNSSGSVTINEFSIYGTGPVIPIKTDVTNVDVNTITKNSANVTWLNPTGYSNITYNGAKVYVDGVLKTTIGSSATDYALSGLLPNTSYNVKVTASYSDGTETTGLIKSFTTPIDNSIVPPSNPTSLIASNVTDTTVKLNLTNSADTDLQSVKIYQNSVLKTTIPITDTYTVTDLVAETNYQFEVSLVDVDGNESGKAIVNVTTSTGGDLLAPNVPSGVSVDIGNTALYVKWNKVTNDDLDGYNVYLDGVKFNTSLIKNNFATLTNLVNAQNYSITVTAVDKTGNESSFSSAVVATPSANALPLVDMDYDLVDVAHGVENWFTSYWSILAFAVSIPLSFYIASRVKLLFLER